MHELLLGVLLVLAVVWLIIRLRRDKAEITGKSAAKVKSLNPFHAVNQVLRECLRCRKSDDRTTLPVLRRAAPATTGMRFSRVPMPVCPARRSPLGQ